ncbi:hypothetical protein CTM94_21230 [Photobacterium leiognathi]|uniref:Fimbrial protein n=1 Tax=Photobacterium leiognathi TaxID=553611 RepID=A0ABX5GAD8_PHOLE|nr:hypothetical protein [Photobacterium leiognathi]PSV74401.1 hypothetical protein CTM94_21230 [Photobacterium leiognathi]
MKKILIFLIIISSNSFASPISFNTNESGIINNATIPITINIVKATCTINNGLGIPTLIDLGTVGINNNKKIDIPIEFSNCNNVNNIEYNFNSILNYSFLGAGKFKTSNSNITLTLYNGDSVINNYKGTLSTVNGNVLFPLKINVLGTKAGAYQSAINLSLIYT